LIVALLWLLTLVLAVSLETATRGTMMAAIMPRIVTTANSSINEKPARLRMPSEFIAILRVGTRPIHRENGPVSRFGWPFSGNRLTKRRSKVSVRSEATSFFKVRGNLVRMAGNTSSGCIDCVGCAVDGTHRQAAGKVRSIRSDIAEVSRRIRGLVSLP